MVEPLRRAEVAHGAGELDPSIRIEQACADDADVVLLHGCVLQAGKPARARFDVGVQHDDIALRARRAQSPVDVRRKALVLLARDHLDAVDLAQRRERLRAARVVGDDDPREPGRHRRMDARDELCDELRVAIARDHDVDRHAFLAIPRHRAPVRVLGAARAQPQPPLQRREAQRERQHAEQQRAPTEVVVGQVDPPAQPRKRPAELAVERPRGNRLGGRDRGVRVGVG